MTQRPPKPFPPKPPKPQKAGERQAGDREAAERRAAERQRADSAFDLWLKRGLHQIYDDVAHEPIPDEWVKLIRDDEAK